MKGVNDDLISVDIPDDHDLAVSDVVVVPCRLYLRVDDLSSLGEFFNEYANTGEVLVSSSYLIGKLSHLDGVVANGMHIGEIEVGWNEESAYFLEP